METKEFEKIFDELRNNAFCRRENNIHRANKAFEKIRHCFPENNQKKWVIEYGHYIDNCSDRAGLNSDLKELYDSKIKNY